MTRDDRDPQDTAGEAPRAPEKDKRAPDITKRRPDCVGPVDAPLTRSDLSRDGEADAEERRLPQVDARGTRAMAIVPQSYDSAARTVEVVLSAGTRVKRYWINEELEISAEAIDLGRVTGGICPLLDSHNQYELDAVLGRVTDAWIEGEELIGRIAFADSDRGREIEARVASGELRAISIGYRVTRWQMTEIDENDRETWRAIAWELLEASLVPVPADPNAVVRSASGHATHGTAQEEDDMRRNLPGGAAAAAPAVSTPTAADPAQARSDAVTPPAATPPAAPANDAIRAPSIAASRILELCGRSDALGGAFANDLIRDAEAGTLTEAGMLGRINDQLIAARPSAPVDARAGASGTEGEGYRHALEDALLLSANRGISPADFAITPEREAAAREFRGMSLRELARDYCNRTGIRTAGMGPMDVAGAALGMRGGTLTTSDFANALGNAVNRRVRQAYLAAAQTFRPLISTDSLPDFRPASVIGMGDAPALLLVKENGEIQHGALNDTGETYKLATYARIIPISRQAIINDDKGLFGRIPQQFANKAADLESDLVYSQFTGNPVMSDGITLFHANHGNLMAGTAINVASVGLAEQAMLTQTSNEGGYLSIRPRFLIVGPAKKVEAQQFLTAVIAAQTSNVNPFPGTMELVVDPRITGNQWFLSADPAAFDTIVLSGLEGQEELYIETHQSFEVDGIKIKARLDKAAKTIDWRGLVKNPGN